MKRLLALIALVAGCYSPTIPNGVQQCAPGNKCAEGYVCGADNKCYKNGQLPSGGDLSAPRDLAGPVDLAMGDLTVPPDMATCTSDNDCAALANTPRCDVTAGACVACLPTNDNCPMGSYCAGASGSYACMAGCNVDGDCKTDAGSLSCCNHRCVDETADAMNCGACNKACGNNTVCCASSCTDTTADPKNCGGCGTACSTKNITAACSAGQCTGTCTANFGDCNNDKRTDGCEVSLIADVANCGGCGKACSTNNITAACSGGQCTGTCAANFGDCNNDKRADGCETSLVADPNHCGACTNVCSSNNIANRTCAGGVCNGTCVAGFADCNTNKLTDGCEANVSADPANCGGCKQACALTCANSLCSYDTGPQHGFAGLAGQHFITQGGCSPSGNQTDATDADYFCKHFYGPACTARTFAKMTLANATDVKLHKDGGCTTLGTDIPNRTCVGPCKIGNWSEVTTGLNNITCRCPVNVPFVQFGGVEWYKVQVFGAMTDTNVRAACLFAGLNVPCTGPVGCMFVDNLCKPSPEMGCGSPMNSLSTFLCGSTPQNCPPLQGVYIYMGGKWVNNSACGVEGTNWCSQGSTQMNRFTLCIP